MRNDTVHTELAALRRDYDLAIAENARLKAAMIPDNVANLARALHLTIGQAQILAFLSHGGIKSRDAIALACDMERFDIRTVDSAIKRIRMNVGSKVAINSVYGAGYELREPHLSFVRSILKGRE